MALIEQLSDYLDISSKLIAQDKNTPGKDRINPSMSLKWNASPRARLTSVMSSVSKPGF